MFLSITTSISLHANVGLRIVQYTQNPQLFIVEGMLHNAISNGKSQKKSDY